MTKKNPVVQYNIDAFQIETFQDSLINWYLTIKRDLPWREDQDPYKIWVSEIMLQQTQVDTVIPYFNRFIEQFPTVDALASADQQDVLKAWEGLGYYSRARNLQSAVREVSEVYGGVVPSDAGTLSKLKGVGPYTQGAIMSIAYDLPEPAVDGNVMRVLSRVLWIDEDIAKAKTRKTFETITRKIISNADPSSFNQGLMELGALICRPKQPKCEICPVSDLCIARARGEETALPVKTKAKKQTQKHYYVAVIETDNATFYIEKRPEQGLLADLYQFPMFEKGEIDHKYFKTYLEAKLNIQFEKATPLVTIKHVFSHLIWNLDVIHLKLVGEVELENYLTVSNREWVRYPFSVPHLKIIEKLMQEGI